LILGKSPSRTACDASENAPEISACEAITVAIVASAIIGNSSDGGTRLKNSLPPAIGAPLRR
jgi:hypothetical protein